MRFVLDNDVDVAVGRVFRKAGHECWTAHGAGLAGDEAALDDAVSVYAHDVGAVVVTHDREFSQRRIRNTYGLHVWLRCDQPDAADLVVEHLEELIHELEALEAAVVEVSWPSGVTLRAPKWE